MSTAPLLSVRNLAIRFAQPRPAVRSVSFDLARGEVLALVGESGSGKSMTARAIIGLLPPGATATGSITFEGTELLGATERTVQQIRGARIGMVFQEPQTALNPVRTIGWQLREALRAHRKLSRLEADLRSVELLHQVEIPQAEARLASYPHQLSGGQKQRVVLALALAGEPDLLLADEPTTALDVTVQAEILDLLHRIRRSTGTSIVLITHNMGVVARLADRVLVLRAGEVLEEGETTALFAAPLHPYTRHLLDSVPRLPDGIGEPLRVVTPGVADDHVSRSQVPPRPLLEYRDVRVDYGSRMRGRVLPAIDGVSLSVTAGEVVSLVGESGSGKTTLGRLAAGLVPLTSGQVHFADRVVLDARARSAHPARDGSIGLVHQDPTSSLDPRFSVGRSIAEPLAIHRVGDAASRAATVRELLDAVRLPTELLHRFPRELSGGQRQRVALARALALQPRLLIADEPTSALDVSVQAEVLRLFGELQREFGFACLFISHDLAVVNEVADRVVVLRAGQIVEQGPAEEVFGRPTHPYTQHLVASVPAPDPSTGLARSERGARRAS